MAPKIFITGITGYIGGHVASTLLKKYPPPAFDITAMVRTEAQAEKVKAWCPALKTVIGDLDSKDVLLKESAAADVVLNMADADHEPSIVSILEGIQQGSGPTPGYLIHTSGTGVIVQQPVTHGVFSPKIYDDVTDIEELNSLPLNQWHREIDLMIQTVKPAPNSTRGIKTAIMSPPTIYGPGSGPGNTRSNQLPWLANSILKHGSGFTVGAGENSWRYIHVEDLADAYVLLVEEACKDGMGGGKATWGREGYYFAENGEYTNRALSSLITTTALRLRLLSNPLTAPLTPEAVDAIHDSGAAFWGSNSRGVATRLRLLGWRPWRAGISELVEEAVKREAAALGLVGA